MRRLGSVLMGVGVFVVGLGIAGLVRADAEAGGGPPTTSIPSPSLAAPATSTTGSTGTTTAPREDAAAFAADLATALREGDAEFLEGRLHPAVAVLYGAESCRSALAGAVDPGRDLTVVSVGDPGRWEWVIDGRSTPLGDVVTVVFADGSEAHFGYVGAELRWFTDCGDPLP